MDLPPQTKLPELPELAQRRTPRGRTPGKPKPAARVHVMPAVIIAIACVLAFKAIDLGRNYGKAFASAEPAKTEKARTEKGAKATDKNKPTEVDPATADLDAGVAPLPDDPNAPITPDLRLADAIPQPGNLSGPKPTVAQCPGPTVAEQAGLSAAEAQVLQSLSDRRRTLENRDEDLQTREQLLAAAAQKVEQRLDEMKALQARVQAALGGLDEKADADTAALVRVYEKMKPKAAAAVMETLDDDIAVRVARRMKEASLATIMQSMNPTRAKHLTELLAKRVDTAKAAAETAIAGNNQPAKGPVKPAGKAANKSAAAAPPQPGA